MGSTQHKIGAVVNGCAAVSFPCVRGLISLSFDATRQGNVFAGIAAMEANSAPRIRSTGSISILQYCMEYCDATRQGNVFAGIAAMEANSAPRIRSTGSMSIS